MTEYISREDILDIASQYCTDDDGSCSKADVDIREMLDEIEALPAADVQPVVETEDLATVTEQFICKNCGIRIENFDKVVLEEDNDGYINKLFYEYRFKFCPECGAKVKEDS